MNSQKRLWVSPLFVYSAVFNYNNSLTDVVKRCIRQHHVMEIYGEPLAQLVEQRTFNPTGCQK